MTHAIDRALHEFAGRQHGLLRFTQFDQVPIHRRAVERRLRAGTLVEITTRVLGLHRWPASPQRQLKAAELDIPGSAITGKPALWLHGLPDVQWGRVQLVAPISAPHLCPIADVRRTSSCEHETRDRIRVVTIPQALIHLARHTSADVLGDWLDAAVVLSKTSYADAEDTLVRQAWLRFAGINRIRSVLEDRSTGFVPPESALEAKGLALLDSLDHPGYAVQASLPWREQGDHCRVDVLIEEWKLIVEFDGRLWHNRMERAEADRLRDLEAAAHGYLVVRITWNMLTKRFRETADHLTRIGQARARQLTNT